MIVINDRAPVYRRQAAYDVHQPAQIIDIPSCALEESRNRISVRDITQLAPNAATLLFDPRRGHRQLRCVPIDGEHPRSSC